MNIGDLARLDTPDNDSGKVVLITNTTASSAQPSSMLYVAIVVGEIEEHVYLRSELKRL
jgi:hypothetical protein